MTRRGESTEAHSLEHAKHSRSVDIGRKLRRVKTHLHMTLRREIVYLIGAHLTDHLHET